MFLYSVYDVILEEFAPPFVAKNDKAACRMFLQAIRKMPSPNDMSLWKVGCFYSGDKDNVISGITPLQIPVEVNGEDE